MSIILASAECGLTLVLDEYYSRLRGIVWFSAYTKPRIRGQCHSDYRERSQGKREGGGGGGERERAERRGRQCNQNTRIT